MPRKILNFNLPCVLLLTPNRTKNAIKKIQLYFMVFLAIQDILRLKMLLNFGKLNSYHRWQWLVDGNLPDKH